MKAENIKTFFKRFYWLIVPLVVFAQIVQIKEGWVVDLIQVYNQFLGDDPLANWHTPMLRYIGKFLYDTTGSIRIYHVIHVVFFFSGITLMMEGIFKKNPLKILGFLFLVFFPSNINLILYFSKEQGAMAAIAMILGFVMLYTRHKKTYLLYAALPFVFYTYAIRSYMIFFILGIIALIFFLLNKKENIVINRKKMYAQILSSIILIFGFATFINLHEVPSVDNERGFVHKDHQRSVLIWELATITQYKGTFLIPEHWIREDHRVEERFSLMARFENIDLLNRLYWHPEFHDVIDRTQINFSETLDILLTEDNFIYFLMHRFFIGMKIMWPVIFPSEDLVRLTIKYDYLHRIDCEPERAAECWINYYDEPKPQFKMVLWAGKFVRKYFMWFILSIVFCVLIYRNKWVFKKLSKDEKRVILICLLGGGILTFFFLVVFAPAGIARYTRLSIFLSHVPLLYVLRKIEAIRMIKEDKK